MTGRALSLSAPVVLGPRPSSPALEGPGVPGREDAPVSVAVPVPGDEAAWGVITAHARSVSGFDPSQVAALQAAGRTVGAHVGARARVERLASRLERAKASLEQSRVFARAAAHDLREPLGTAKGFLTVLADRAGSELDGEALECIERSTRALERMGELVTSLRDQARARTRRHPLETVDADEALDGALEDLARRIERSNARVEREALPVVLADPVQLRRVFQNLVDNAIKHGGVDGPPRVRVRARLEAGWWHVSVADDGPGLDAGDRCRVFDAFERGSGSGGVEGDGLGLATCRAIVEQYGGSIRAGRAPGGGARFEFTVPAVDAGTGNGRSHALQKAAWNPALDENGTASA